MTAELKDRLILITGASAGIGRAIALHAAHQGARILAHGRDSGRLASLISELPGQGHAACELDLADSDGVEAWADDLARTHGPLSGFVHSAGLGPLAPLKLLNPADLDKVWRVNVASAIMICKSMRKPANHKPGASIVFLSSVAGLKGRPGAINYSASKGALIAVARAMALELVRDNIRVNALAPAMVATEMFEAFQQNATKEAMGALLIDHPMGIGETADVAKMACYLLSDQTKWITGTTISVDGGYAAR